MISQERKDYPYYIGHTVSLFMRRLNQEEFLCFIKCKYFSLPCFSYLPFLGIAKLTVSSQMKVSNYAKSLFKWLFKGLYTHLAATDTNRIHILNELIVFSVNLHIMLH